MCRLPPSAVNSATTSHVSRHPFRRGCMRAKGKQNLEGLPKLLMPIPLLLLYRRGCCSGLPRVVPAIAGLEVLGSIARCCWCFPIFSAAPRSPKLAHILFHPPHDLWVWLPGIVAVESSSCCPIRTNCWCTNKPGSVRPDYFRYPCSRRPHSAQGTPTFGTWRT